MFVLRVDIVLALRVRVLFGFRVLVLRSGVVFSCCAFVLCVYSCVLVYCFKVVL